MNSNRLLYIILFFCTLTGCSKEELISYPTADSNELTATIEALNSESSRIGFTDGNIFWHQYDKMNVTLTQNGVYSSFSPFTLNSASMGKPEGSFIGAKDTKEQIGKYAAYPAKDSKFTKENLIITYPLSYDYNHVDQTLPAGSTPEELLAFNNFNPRMAGSINKRNVTLKHLGGIICFDIVKMPCTTGKFTFTTDQNITGNATLTHGKWDATAFNGVGGDELTDNPGKEVSIAFDNAIKDAHGLFYVPVPVGTYSDVNVKIANADGIVILENTFKKTITIKRTDFIKYGLSDNGVEVAKLKAAIANLDTYKMEYDVNIIHQNIEIPANKNFTLDLGGHAITANNKYGDNIHVKGQLTLMNSEGDGQINADTPYSNEYSNGIIAVNGENAHFTMQGGNINTQMSKPSNEGQFGVVLGDGADFTMTGGKIEAGWYAVSGNGNYKTQNTVINITGGELTSIADYAIYLPHQGTTNISGGTINGAAGAVSMNRGVLNITGGTLKSDNTGITGEWSDGTGGQGNRVLHIVGNYGDCKVKIDGGTFTAKGEQPALLVQPNVGNQRNVTINGGTFTGKVKCEPNANAQLIINGGTFSDPTILDRLQPAANVGLVLNEDYTSTGLSFNESDEVTIEVDLNQHTWTLAQVVSRTRSNSIEPGFHFAGKTNISLKNGKMDASAVAGSVFNNFSQFALDSITVNGGPNTDYIVKNNGGICTISNSTLQPAEGKPAILSTGKNSITIEGKSTVVNGNIVFDGTTGSSLDITGGTFNGKLQVEKGKEIAAAYSININGGDFTDANADILKYTKEPAQPEDLCLTIKEPIVIDETWGKEVPRLYGTLTVETTTAHSIECNRSLTVENAVINTTNPKGKAVFHIANNGITLKFDNTIVNHEISGDADGSDNSGLIVRVDKGNSIGIHLYNTTFNLNGEKGYQRAIVFPGFNTAQTGCKISLRNSHIIAKTTSTMPNATYSIGLGYGATPGIKVDLTESSIKGMYYPINHFANKGGVTPDGAKISIVNSTLEGFAAMNIHSGSNMTINIWAGSVLCGRNYYREGQNDFGTIFFDQTNPGQKCTINVDGSTIKSFTGNTSIQNLMTFRKGWKYMTVKFDDKRGWGKAQLVDEAKAPGTQYDYMILDQTGGQLEIKGEDKVVLTGKKGVQLVYKDPKF